MILKNIALQLITLAVLSGANVLAARLLGADGFAVLSLAQATSAWSMPILMIGLTNSAAVLVGRRLHRVSNVRWLLLAMSVFAGGCFLIGGIAFQDGLSLDLPRMFLFSTAMLIWSQGLFSGLNATQLGESNFVRYLGTQGVRAAVWLIAVLAFLSSGSGVLAISLLALSFFATSLTILPSSMFRGGVRYATALFRSGVATGLRGSLAATIAQLMLRIDLYWVAFYVGQESAGRYAAVQMLGALFIHAAASAGMIFFPLAAKERTITDRRAMWRTCGRMLAVLSLIALAIAVVGETFLRFLFGADFANLGAVLHLYLVGVVAVASASPIASYLAGRGYKPDYLLAHGVALVVTSTCCSLLIPRFGLPGAAAAGSAGLVSLSLGMVWAFSRLDRLLPRT